MGGRGASFMKGGDSLTTKSRDDIIFEMNDLRAENKAIVKEFYKRKRKDKSASYTDEQKNKMHSNNARYDALKAELDRRDKVQEINAYSRNVNDKAQTTTTYENARRRRMKNFDAWWNGSK